MTLSAKFVDPAGEPKKDFPGETVQEQSDRPLNFEQEQEQNLNRQLRKLYLHEDLDRLRAFTSMLVLGSGLGLMVARKYRWGAAALTGFLLLEAWEGLRSPAPSPRNGVDPELARRAAKAERGDFGNLEVIPFK